ncbi:MAG: VanW family protein [Verrucomicrobiota bacterium]
MNPRLIEIPETLPCVGRDRLSHRFAPLLRVMVAFHRTKRRLRWLFGRETYAGAREAESLPFRAHRHSSLLLRRLGDSDPRLQVNKITNLRIVASVLDGLLIRPGETFSFCRLVGRPTRTRGFVEGLELSRGQARQGVGGGICQAANLLHWLVLHSPLTVVERRQHSFDPFPDEGRIIPFGTGAAIFYNYVDYQFHNPTPRTFQIRLWLTEKTLEGDLRCSAELEHKYRVRERNHAFLKIGPRFYRTNEIWRIRTLKCRSVPDSETLMTRNFALLKYGPKEYQEVPPGQRTFIPGGGEAPEADS